MCLSNLEVYEHTFCPCYYREDADNADGGLWTLKFHKDFTVGWVWSLNDGCDHYKTGYGDGEWV